jgi:hypothetical protein
VGFSLTHLISKARHLPQHRSALAGGAMFYWFDYVSASGFWIIEEAGAESRIVRHTLACMLARVAGRSPLEYLTDQERADQQRDVLSLMQKPPEKVSHLIKALVPGAI